jgi:hypothetical protein
VNRVRLGLALAGFVLAVLSVAREDHRLAWGAIALLIGSLIIRLLQRKRQDRESGAGT